MHIFGLEGKDSSTTSSSHQNIWHSWKV